MRREPLHSRQLLRGVSRSFDLSIRLLPGALREPVGLAYLLARASDTVADTPLVPAADRLTLLKEMSDVVHTSADHTPLAQALRDFARHVPDPHEKALLERSQACLDALTQQPADDQALIRQVLSAILEGQRWDLSALDNPQRGVQTHAEVERYTWLVAGSVGEFWTGLCELHLQHWHNSAGLQPMRQWGARYGQGLQRLNILRDAHRDLQAGRCYFPAQALAPLALDCDRLVMAVRQGDRNTLQALAPLLQAWLQDTEALLHDGLRYSLTLRGWRLRLASALPCLIGIRTLTLLRRAGTQALLSHVKLPRSEVRRMLWRLLLTGVSDRSLQRSWDDALLSDGAAPVSARIGA